MQVGAEPPITQVGYLNSTCLIGKLIPGNHLTVSIPKRVTAKVERQAGQISAINLRLVSIPKRVTAKVEQPIDCWRIGR